MFKEKNVLVMVSGSVAAYKTATLIRLLIKSGAQVRVGMTKSAQEFITSKTLAILSGHDVLTDLFSDGRSAEVIHIDWAKWADIIFVVPATANLIGKIAHGLADDAVTATVMASSADKIIAPAMNDVMLRNAAVERNIATLSADGWLVISPVTGFLAEGYEAKGRLPEPIDILQQANIRLRAKSGQLVGKKVLITAGGTREALDPVRYLTNRSSGKMGYALAQAAAENGAQVFLITTVDRGNIFGVKRIQVESTQDMYEETRRLFPDMDIFIGAAAVSDFKAAHLAEHKIKKQSDAGLTLELTQNPDILKAVGHDKTEQQIVVGFAAETQNIVAYGQNKLIQKHANMLIVNDVSQADTGFSSDNNAVTILVPGHEPEVLAKTSKTEIARDIMTRISSLK
ncbi:bifunctional phosphopantothenoylcysteine decarboxylase/phosphopantothenate--cysteine ligase CoaBC [Leuconostoc rapi]|uniref:bifunctional phosphopantothenoylcysteine decarboxylase/phosphopantothenate--cysteine ligase CoaBC n=1 Tax=Leuconostoc rapi TaxID=1406906 RepID=UPI0019570476|nr:bifunctional phosphopantothenoylcysteine decarboxylase/phosphopantothenate--cysteine ligase CoaBC [Leuconostoc rapi]MBM7434968.1 phosphopantothenoylcysteine decarboxylase/phosphopantothenate--cysteine ligase [Leuconostoc rapi]